MASFFDNIVNAAKQGGLGNIVNQASQAGGLGGILNSVTGALNPAQQQAQQQAQAAQQQAQAQAQAAQQQAPQNAASGIQGALGGLNLGSMVKTGAIAASVIGIINMAGNALRKR